MWKTLKPGEAVAVGDTLRYVAGNSTSKPNGEIYDVVKADQHYFEIAPQIEGAVPVDAEGRKIIRYIDVGYNLRLERWCEVSQTGL